MTRSRFYLQLAAAAVGCVVCGTPSYAIDLTGAWASDASVCNKIFAKDGSRIAFTQDSDTYGSGFIIEGKHIRGQSAKCEIRSRSEEAGVIHMIAACATDIMLQTVQMSVKVVNDNSIIRFFPGMPDITMNYSRCSL
jgi:hypothetical protein